MPENAAKALVLLFYSELFRNLEAAVECIGSTYVDHNDEKAGRGQEVLRAHVAAMRQTFPDFRIKIEDMIAEGDRVVTRVVGNGTHTGCMDANRTDGPHRAR